MMRRRGIFAAVVLLPVLVGLVIHSAGVTAVQEDPFPHEDHQGLFPVCSGCHQGIESGNTEAFYPEPSQCSGCHDGEDVERVEWNGPTTTPSNVIFDHVGHAQDLQSAGDPAASCESCHSDPEAGRMTVDGSEELSTCWSCHAHQRVDHFSDQGAAGACEDCHVPLAESGFDRSRIEALSTPESHDRPDFLAEVHGESAEGDLSGCVTCHTQDRCVSCHVDTSLSPIPSVPRAPSSMTLPEWKAEYPEPTTHTASDFGVQHTPADGDEGSCSTCHTQDDCASCHLEPVPASVTALPGRAETVAPGAELVTEAPESHESVFFQDAHPTMAAASPSECATCHTEAYCVECHDGPSDGGYHEANYLTLHSATAYGRDQECATCHNAAAFCRECHESSGLGSQGRLGPGYHDAEPIFLLRHGQAARQNLESCASCHQQRDCVQCHGVLGSFQVSPHTSDFDAESAWERNPRTCFACHISNPLGGIP